MDSAQTKLAKTLFPYQKKVEELIGRDLDRFGPDTPLRSACSYALTNGGKRFRPALTMMVGDALGRGGDLSCVALAVEYFHTASLIADDLPSMDNDDVRREKPSTHKVYGESVALLASYALIAAGYERIADCAACLSSSSLPFAEQADHLAVLALRNAGQNTGILGATGGQYLDLYPPDVAEETLREVIFKKTVTLFELSFVFGWLFGGGDPALLEQVKKGAEHFGLAFQLADDLSDQKQDLVNERAINYVNVLGMERSSEMFHVELERYLLVIKELKIDSEPLFFLAEYLDRKWEGKA